MDIKAVLFDLDGTLLPMRQEHFIKAYFGGLAKQLAAYGYEADALVQAIWSGTAAMVKNDGTVTNEQRFLDTFAKELGERVRGDMWAFDEFYQNHFDSVQASCGFDARAAAVIQAVKAKGLRVALATNPLFPSVATERRIAWAGLSPNDFEYFTTYENSHYCKPNPNYYREVLSHLGLSAEECIMVGNDVDEDMVAQTLGMRVFLLTDCLINKKNIDISQYQQGGFDELLDYIATL